MIPALRSRSGPIRAQRRASPAVQAAAARVRIAADKQMGYRTPTWILGVADLEAAPPPAYTLRVRVRWTLLVAVLLCRCARDARAREN